MKDKPIPMTDAVKVLALARWVDDKRSDGPWTRTWAESKMQDHNAAGVVMWSWAFKPLMDFAEWQVSIYKHLDHQTEIHPCQPTYSIIKALVEWADKEYPKWRRKTDGK